jgi:DNA recombination-dependent growth factor C
VIGVLYGTEVAEIASDVLVDAGAAKAAETVVATIANTIEALPIREGTEEQNELWAKRVI